MSKRHLSPVGSPLKQFGLAVQPVEQQDELVQHIVSQQRLVSLIVAGYNYTWEKQ